MKLATLQKLSKEDLVKLCLDYGFDMAKVMSLEEAGLIGLLNDDKETVKPVKDIEQVIEIITPANNIEADLQQRIIDLENIVKGYKVKVSDAHNERDRIKDTLLSVGIERDGLKVERDNSRKNNNELSSECNSYQNRIKFLENKVSEVSNSVGDSDLQSTIIQMQKDNNELQANYDKLIKDNREALRLLDRQNDVIDSLKGNSNELSDTIDAKDKIIKELQKKDSKNILAKEGMQIVIDDLTKEIKVLRDNSNPCNGITGDHQTCIDMREDLFKQVEELSKYDIRDIKERRAKFASELAELDSVLN
jgi:chromosome segregation ATPase